MAGGVLKPYSIPVVPTNQSVGRTRIEAFFAKIIKKPLFLVFLAGFETSILKVEASTFNIETTKLNIEATKLDVVATARSFEATKHNVVCLLYTSDAADE